MPNEYCFSCFGGRVSFLRVGRVFMLECFGASLAMVGRLWCIKCGSKSWGNLKGADSE